MKKPIKPNGWMSALKRWHPYFTLCLCAYYSMLIFFRVMEFYYPEFHGVMAIIVSALDIFAPISGGNALDPTEWANYWE